MPRSRDSVAVGVAIPSLVPWGRSPDADLVYRAMATVIGAATAGDLARELGMARHRITDALAELESIDAVEARQPAGGPRMRVWVPRPPAELIASLRRGLTRASARRSAVPAPRAPMPYEWMLPGVARHLQTKAMTRLRLAELVGVARHEHLAMNTELVFDPASARFGVPMDRKLLARGVAMRVLGVHEGNPDPLLRYGRDPAERRPDYRTTPNVPMKLFVIDRKVALLPVAQEDFAQGYLEVAHPPLVEALVSLFDRHWDAARDILEHVVPDLIMNARERAVVTLLAAGHTDATAARELRISQRSVTNVLRALMDRLGVDNRFQLGLALGSLHVVGPRRPSTTPKETEEKEHQ